MIDTLIAGTFCVATFAQGVVSPSPSLSEGRCPELPIASSDISLESRTDADERCRDAIDGLVDSLLDWIAGHSAYDVAAMHNNPPAVAFVQSGDYVECEGVEYLVEADMHAVYDLSTRQIRIVLPWSLSEPFDQSILLHELVHDVQLNSRHWYCRAETEFEAYKLQDEWLQERGIDSGFDWLHVFFLSKCPRDIHP